MKHRVFKKNPHIIKPRSTFADVLLTRFNYFRYKIALKKRLKRLAKLNALASSSPQPVHLRPALPGVGPIKSLEDVANLIKSGKCKNVLVLTGAGLSTAAGIPDFRTPGTGLYDNLQKYNLPRPTAVFELDFFYSNPAPFFALSKELTANEYNPTKAHHLIRLLADQGVLLRNYTQNIDGLEFKAGIPEDLVICAHGNFHTGHCINPNCRQEYGHEWLHASIHSDYIPSCVKCHRIVKPDITMFGEPLPQRFLDSLEADCRKCDLLIVMGTSLQVLPTALIPKFVDGVPRILINRERGGSFQDPVEMCASDLFWQGDCDHGAEILAEHLGLKEKLTEACAKMPPLAVPIRSCK